MTPTETQSHTERLYGYSLTDWQPLFAFIPQMESSEQLTGDALENLVWDFVRASTRTPNIEIVFDWPNWHEGKAVVMQPKLTFEHYDLLTLCMFITAIVRAERFNEGILMDCYERGIIVSVLKAIKARVEEHFHQPGSY
ncbi:DUF6508 domain-containing protein [Spirosoma luteum]|uniref:DUF6508 domain-containing protein n=1 Tax=Spirosoma luteum TaxID=431553 RepID=UPI00039996C7|nr:DUF6508 domain-containing protein [Spirosoma luteum]